MKKIKQKFSWDGVTDDFTGDTGVIRDEFLANEIFTLDCYEHIYPVKEGDIVLDLGASIGPFTWKVMDRALKVYAVEPMIDLIPTIKKNTDGFPVTIINEVLSPNNGEVEFNDGCINTFEPKMVKTVDFKTLLKENNIDKIDYIKTDCEGGEYDLINNVNLPWIKENVRNIVGEWHLAVGNEDLKADFRYFRDKFLPQFKNFEVYSIDNCDIKWDLYNEHFLEYYRQILIHIEV
jgi:FkbM family methyltransferase|tara:strand:- start:1363 stop:2064 length:702 start_codon:yes stop_codon:yes gene_type:complete